MNAQTSRFDHILITIFWGELTMDDVDAFREQIAAKHAKGQRWATFVDARHVDAPSSRVRRALAEMSNGFVEEAKRNSVCVSVILNSNILIGALTAVRWFLKTDVDLRYFRTAAEGIRFVGEQLAAEKLTLAPDALALAKKLDSAKPVDLPAFAERTTATNR